MVMCNLLVVLSYNDKGTRYSVFIFFFQIVCAHGLGLVNVDRFSQKQ